MSEYNTLNYREDGKWVVGGELEVTGTLNISGDTAITGDATIGGDIAMTGDATFGGETEFTGPISIAGTAQFMGVRQYKWTALQAVAADADGLLESFASVADAVTKTTFAHALPCARNITITSGGTALANIAAGDIVITGKDINGATITETATVTADTALTYVGAKAFASVDSIAFPAMAGTGATFTAGWGDKLGLPMCFTGVFHLVTYLDGSAEGTAPTIVVSATVVSGNTVDLNSNLNGKTVETLFVSR